MDMVQRTRLAVVILLALLAGSLLYSQEETGFTPPKLVSEPILSLPANWKEVYTPPEVMILIQVKADSTALLIKILDGKEELKPIIEESLPDMVFSPAIVNGKAIDTNLSLKLQIASPFSKQDLQAEADSLKLVDKDSLIQDIKNQLEKEDHQRMFAEDTYYRTNYYLMGLNNDSDIIIKDGFIQPARIYYNALQYQMFLNFRDVNSTERQYSWSSTLTDIYAGLGDYEFNFAKGQVLKNHLFGVKDFYTEFGFLVQNGWWQETISDQTSTRLFLRLPIRDSQLTFNFESYDQNIPSTVLLPGLQNGSLFRIGQKLQEIYLKWSLPWLTAGWQTGREQLNSANILNKQEYDYGKILVQKFFNILATDFDLTYQNNYKSNLPEVQSLYQYNKKNDHQGLIRTSHKHNHFSNENQLLVSEDGLDMINSGVSYYISPMLLTGLYYKFYHGMDSTFTDKSLYADNNPVTSPSTYIMRTFAANLEWLPFPTKSVVLKLEGGSHIYVTDNNNANLSNEIHMETDRPFVDLKLSAEKKIYDLMATWDQTLNWTQYKKGLFEQPELTGQTRLKLVKDMKYNNALSIGLNLTGHTDYMQADNKHTPIYGSMIADAWFGVKITDSFEFQLMMKNLGDNTIFGLYPHPRTIIGTIHWFFLN